MRNTYNKWGRIKYETCSFYVYIKYVIDIYHRGVLKSIYVCRDNEFSHSFFYAKSLVNYVYNKCKAWFFV